jgi:HlyD family secretion protein
MKKLLLFLVFVGLGLGGATYWLNSSSKANNGAGFETVVVEFGKLTENINATGLVQPRDVTFVGSELSGRVVEIYSGTDYNQIVQKDQPLLRLDDQMARLKVEQAKEAVQLAEANVDLAVASRDAAQRAEERARELLQKALIQKGEADKASAVLATADAALKVAHEKVAEARNALEQAQYGLELTVVRAPVTGTVIDKKVVLGQLIGPPLSAQLWTIASDLKTIQVNAQIAEGDIGRVRVGLPATFTVYAYSDDSEPFSGTLMQIRPVPTNVQGAVYYGAIIEAANRPLAVDFKSASTKEWMLRPGMTATVEIHRRHHENVWKMPAAAINFQLDEAYVKKDPATKAKIDHWQERNDRDNWKPVWILKDKKPWPIFVRVGGIDKNRESGIKDGQFTEVLEWDPEVRPSLDPKDQTTFPKVIITAPPATKPGLFDTVHFKIS